MRSRMSFTQRILSAARALTGVQNPQQQAQQARASLPPAISDAQAQITGAKNFIASRPGGAGPDAHVRIAEAESQLSYAMSVQTNDPVSGLMYARQAADLAQQAGQLAQADLNGFTMKGGGPPGGYGGGFGGRGFGGGGFASGFGGGVLGGILGGLLSGGNRGGWGGGGFGDDDGRDFDGSGGDGGSGFGGDSGGGDGDFGGGSGGFGGDGGNF